MVEKPNVKWKIYLKKGEKMNKKRFNFKLDEIGSAYYLCDNNEIIAELWGDKSEIKDIVDLLNKQSDKITEQSVQIDFLQDENKQLEQDKKRLIGFLLRYKGVDVDDIDELIFNDKSLDEWGDLY